MTSAVRTSFGCCGVISVEDDFSLETTEASWVWVASVRAIKFAFGRLRGTARRRDILQLSWLWFALRRESESVDNNSHACYISSWAAVPAHLCSKNTSIGCYDVSESNVFLLHLIHSSCPKCRLPTSRSIGRPCYTQLTK